MNVATVINIKNRSDIENIDTCIAEFFEYRKEESIKTYNNYKLWIEEFFSSVMDKDLVFITWEDMQGVSAYDINKYKEFLKQKNNAPRTINAKKSAVKSFFQKMKVYNESINVDVFNGEKEKVKGTQSNSWDSLTIDEVEALLEFTKEFKTKTKNGVVHLFFKTLYITGVRHHVLDTLTLDNLTIEIDKLTQNRIHVLKVHDKTDDKIIAITNDLYNEFIEMAEGDKIFPVNLHTIRRVLKEFCKANDITDRKIVLHSIRKSSGDYVYKATGGDLTKTAEHLDHKNINTTKEWYVGRNKQLESQASYSMFNDDSYNIDMLEDCSKEELLYLISKSGTITIKELVEMRSSHEKDKRVSRKV